MFNRKRMLCKVLLWSCSFMCSVKLTEVGSQNLNTTVSKINLIVNSSVAGNNITDKSNGLIEHKERKDYSCEHKNYIRKCCRKDEILFNEKCKPSNKTLQFNVYDLTSPINVTIDHFCMIYNNGCSDNTEKHLLKPWIDGNNDAFYIQSNGQLYLPKKENQPKIDYDKYCIETFQVKEENFKVSVIHCKLPSTPINNGLIVAMMISIPFLLLTFLTYAVLPDKNIHGKSMMCYVLSLLFAYLVLVCITLNPMMIKKPESCVSLALLCLYCFKASFFWMNVICIDIWRTFSGIGGFSIWQQQTERKRFLFYSAYAWGMPALFIILILSINDTTSISWYNPAIGAEKCWFVSDITTLLYFYGPITILLIANATFFAITAYKIKKVHKDTAILRNYEKQEQCFHLFLKLTLAMGINWMMEIISWLINWQTNKNAPKELWYLSDFCNAAYGVVIFLIFVFKKKILLQLRKQYIITFRK